MDRMHTLYGGAVADRRFPQIREALRERHQIRKTHAQIPQETRHSRGIFYFGASATPLSVHRPWSAWSARDMP